MCEVSIQRYVAQLVEDILWDLMMCNQSHMETPKEGLGVSKHWTYKREEVPRARGEPGLIVIFFLILYS